MMTASAAAYRATVVVIYCNLFWVFVGSRACAANHYVIAEKCPYFRIVCRVQFGDRRLHRIVVDHSFVISFGKCRNAHGTAENKHFIVYKERAFVFRKIWKLFDKYCPY